MGRTMAHELGKDWKEIIVGLESGAAFAKISLLRGALSGLQLFLLKSDLTCMTFMLFWNKTKHRSKH